MACGSGLMVSLSLGSRVLGLSTLRLGKFKPGNTDLWLRVVKGSGFLGRKASGASHSPAKSHFEPTV